MANSTKISEYSTTAANNTSIDSIDIDENCAASGINNALRSVLKHQADAFTQGTPIALDQTNNRVGIGTTSPASIAHALHATSPKLTLERDSTSLANNNVIGEIAMAHKDSNDAGTAVRIIGRAEGTAGAAGLAFNTGTPSSISEAVRITSDGYVGVGEVSPTNLLQIDVGSRTTSGLVIENSSTNGYYGGVYRCHTNNGYAVLFQRGNSSVGSIFAGTSSTSYNTSSDHRLKENVADITGAITRVKQLAPKRFNFINDADTTVDGFIAHEAQAVVPEAVTGTHNEVDDDGNAVMQGIDQSKLVPLLTGALQEAIAKIETLETEMTALKARVTALEA